MTDKKKKKKRFEFANLSGVPRDKLEEIQRKARAEILEEAEKIKPIQPREMAKPRGRFRKHWKFASILGILLTISTVFGASMLYQLRVPQTMVAKSHPSLELLDEFNVTVLSVNWGEFERGETRIFNGFIKNTGDIAIPKLSWTTEKDEEFTSGLWEITLYLDATLWNKQTAIQVDLQPNQQIGVQINLKNVLADYGVSYSFDLLLEALE